jgi:hypothetical protein
MISTLQKIKGLAMSINIVAQKKDVGAKNELALDSVQGSQRLSIWVQNQNLGSFLLVSKDV